MKMRILAFAALVAILAAVSTYGVSAQIARPRAERHPALVHALRALTNARAALQHANRDFGGHRAKAQALTDQAIQEVNAAIAFDRR